MKNFKLTFLLLGVLSLTSCEDYLSEVPDNRTQIDSPEKIQELLVGAYPVSYYAPFLETMSDNFDDKGNLSATIDEYLRAYSWEDIITDDSDTPISYWNSCYEAIAHANQALVSIEELENEMDLSAEKGEALLARAYCHFMLVNIWAKHYDPATASSDLGIPYVTEPETEAIAYYSRNTVKEVYDMIEQDLEEGLALVENNYYTQPKYHFTPEAASAFAARFYLYRGDQNENEGGKNDWEKVIEHSSNILSNVENKLRDWPYYRNNLQISEIGAEVMSPTESSNLLVVVPYSNWYQDNASSRFGLSVDKLEDLFRSPNPYGKEWAYQVVFFSNGGLTYTINKFDYIFEYTDLTAGIGYRRTSVALLTHDETLLARAEAYAMQNDFTSALTDINTFLAKKTVNYSSSDELTKTQVLQQYPNTDEYSPYYSLTSEQASFVKCVAELRRREFYMEGLRWFDIKRFNIPVTHEFINQSDKTLAPEDPRRLIQIPPSATAFGVQENPR